MSNLNRKSASLKVLMASGVALAAIAAGGQAFAQSRDNAVEEVVVTGTSIRGVAPVGSSLIGVTRDQIQAVAPTNVKDLLATVPTLGNFGTNAEQSTPNRFRTQGYLANIHNLGIYATLTLLNGHRVAAVGTEGSFPDPSSVPTIAIQRTEIIADGASAIYGSDATAGVVNFIYRKPFDGVETSATYSFDNETSYERRNFGIIGGKTWDGGGGLLAYEYSSNESPLTTEIPFLALGSDQTSRGGRDSRGTTCLTPTYRAISPTNGAAFGSTYGAASKNFSTNVLDQRCGIIAPSTVIQNGERHAFLGTVEHQLTDNLKVWAELNYSHYEGYSIGGQPGMAIAVPKSNPFLTQANTPPALWNQLQSGAINSVFVNISGNQFYSYPVTTPGTSTITTFAGGLDIDLGADWKGSFSLVASRTRDFFRNREFDLLNLRAALADTNPATAFNIFGNAANNNPATLAKINNETGQFNWGQQGMQEFSFKADGPVMTLPGGELRAAVGASFRASQANALQLAGSRQAGAGYNAVVRDDHPRQQVSAAFFELNAPLVSEQNALPLVKTLTVSISGRYDYYDKYQGTFNPKYGVVYAPIDDLRFHASYGTNFNAPNVGLLTGLFGQPGYNSNPNLTIGYGPYKGTLLTNINQYTLSGQGGGNLTPEEAKTKSFGVEYTPSYIPGLRAGVNWYYVDYSNLFFKVTGSDLITNEAFSSLAEFFPTPERMAQILKLYPPSNAILVPNFEYVPHTEAVNLGTRIYEGLDYDISYRFSTDNFGQFQLGVTANQQLQYKQKVLPTQPFQDRFNTTDVVEWKARFNAGWIYKNLTLSAFYNYTGEYTNNTSVVVANQKVDAFKTLDLRAAYEFKDIGVSYLKGVTLQGGINNVFDKDPPFFDNAGGYNGNWASPFPRSFDVTLRAKF